MGKSETKAYVEAWAKSTGKPIEEIIAEVTSLGGGFQKSGIQIPVAGDKELSPVLRAILEAQKLEREMGTVGKEGVSPVVKMMMETVTMMPLMKIMGGMGQDSGSGQNINDMLAKNDEKWERRLAQDKADRKEEALQARLDRLESLVVQQGTGKKDDPLIERVLSEIKETKVELATQKDLRQKEALDAKNAEFKQYKEYMDDRIDAIENREPPKSTDDIIFEEGERLRKYEDLMTKYGKAHGWSREKIAQGIEEGKTVMQQLLGDLVGKDGILAKYVDVLGRKQHEKAEEPQIAPSEAQIVCKDCGNVSDNGTEICNLCQQAYAAEQQKAQAEADATSRQAGEIPTNVAEPE